MHAKAVQVQRIPHLKRSPRTVNRRAAESPEITECERTDTSFAAKVTLATAKTPTKKVLLGLLCCFSIVLRSAKIRGKEGQGVSRISRFTKSTDGNPSCNPTLQQLYTNPQLVKDHLSSTLVIDSTESQSEIHFSLGNNTLFAYGIAITLS